MEVALRMCAYRTDLRRFFSDDDMSAVGALPDHVAFLGKNKSAVDVGDQLTITLLMLLFDFSNGFKEISDVVEALFLGFLGEFRVHIGPLKIFTGCGVL